MTNEEKALEICGGNYRVFNKGYSAALQMADWKDQQAELLTQTAYESGYDKARQEMKEYLEKKKSEYKGKIGYYLFNKIINELFKEEQI